MKIEIKIDLFDQQLPLQLACGVDALDAMRKFIRNVVSAALSSSVLYDTYRKVGEIQEFGTPGGSWSLHLHYKGKKLFAEYWIDMGPSQQKKMIYSAMPGSECLSHEHVRAVRSALPVFLKGLRLFVAEHSSLELKETDWKPFLEQEPSVE